MKLHRNTPAERLIFWSFLALVVTVPAYQMGAWSCRSFHQDLYIVVAVLMSFFLGIGFGFLAFAPVKGE